MQRAVAEGLQHRPEAQVGKVVVNQAQGDAIDPAQGAQVDDILALANAKGLGNVRWRGAVPTAVFRWWDRCLVPAGSG